MRTGTRRDVGSRMLPGSNHWPLLPAPPFSSQVLHIRRSLQDCAMALHSSHSVRCNSGYIKPQQGHQRSLHAEQTSSEKPGAERNSSGQSAEWKPRGDQQEAAGSRGESLPGRGLVAFSHVVVDVQFRSQVHLWDLDFEQKLPGTGHLLQSCKARRFVWI